MRLRVALAAPVALAVALFTAGCSGVTEAQRKESTARMQIGITFLQQQRVPDAMRQLAKAAELDPENADVDLGLGLAYLQRHYQGGERSDLLLSEKHLRAACRKRKNYADAHNNLGVVFGLLGKGDEAIDEFRLAGENVYYDTPERAYYNMAIEYRRQRKPELAEKAFRRSIILNDRYVDSHLGLSFLLEGKGSRDEAVAQLDKCASLSSGDYRCRVELGRILRDQGKTSEARRILEEVVRSSMDAGVKLRAEDLLRSLGVPAQGGGK